MPVDENEKPLDECKMDDIPSATNEQNFEIRKNPERTRNMTRNIMPLPHFDLKKLNHWRKKNVTQIFRSNDSFFRSVHREIKFSHFDLKSLVPDGKNLYLNF